MSNEGLREIKNPSEIFIRKDSLGAGSVIVPTIEGTRPILIELQALVSQSGYGMARRTVLGIDVNRIAMLIAIIEKHLNIKLYDKDVFFNVAGGLKISDPGVDLGIVMAIVTSLFDKEIPENTAFIGEIGLSGEIRSVSQIESRLKESIRLGYGNIVLPKEFSLNSFSDKDLKRQGIIQINNIKDLKDKNII